MNRDQIKLLALLLSVSMTAGAVSPAVVYAEEMETTAVVEQTQAAEEQPQPLTEETTVPTEQTEEGTEASSESTEMTEFTNETEAGENTEVTEETATTENTETTESTESTQTTESTETTAPTDETQPSEEAEDSSEETEEPSEEIVYPWDEMDDETFAVFIREEQYLAYAGDEDAAASLLDRVDRVEDDLLREELLGILIAWLFPVEEESKYTQNDAGPVSLEVLNGADMFFKQEIRGTCTLAANAMLVRRAARLNGYADWRSITESALKGTAWIEGTGMCWNYSYAGINVVHGNLQNCSMESFVAFLKQHPEGFVAYNANWPHAVLITDYDESTGTIYCADPGYANWRMPLSESILYYGTQEATVAGFTAYWVVSSPKLTLAPSLPPLTERVITVTAESDGTGVDLSWNDTNAAGYWIYRSEDEEGPWQTPIHTTSAGSSSWRDDSAQVGVTYYYTVCSFDAQGEAGYLSEPVACTPERQVAKLGQGNCTETIRWIAYEDGMLLVMGTGSLPNYSNEAEEPWLSIRNQITEIHLSDGITYVGSSNFGGMENLTRVVLPASVTSIGDWAFLGCSSLTEIAMPGVTSIGYATFRRCLSLAELEIPDAVSSIGDWAFSKCSGLRRIVLPASLKHIGIATFYEDAALETVELPAGLTSIGGHAFRGCEALSSVSIPSSVTRIESYAFALCDSLGGLDLSGCTGGLTLGKGAFFNCTGITRLHLPGCQIEDSAFAYCYGLRTVILDQGGTVSSLGNEAFNYCVSLSKFLALGSGFYAAGNTFQNTAATILVNGGYYGNLDTVIGQCRWRSYQSAGACSDQVQWYLDNAGNLVVYGSGEIPSYGAYEAPWNGSSAKKVTVERGITGVGNFAFNNLPQLDQIYFPSSAPSFAASALAGVGCEVLYHNTDGSWTGIVGSQFGGTPIWRENHSYSWKLVKAPGFITGGELAGSCSVCGSTANVQVPKLDKDSYEYVETATTARYTWKITEFGPICFELQLVTIQRQPYSVMVNAGERAVFTVQASGNGLAYQWQRLDPGSGQWVVCGGNSSALKLEAAFREDNGSQFRCIVTDGNGKSVTSEIVTLTVH